MNRLPDRSSSEVSRRGYSEEEITSIYELGKLFLENGAIRQAEIIMQGLIEVAPEFAPGWLGLSYILTQQKNFDAAAHAAAQAQKVDRNLTEAYLFLSACLLTTGDYNAAGTYLGEVRERIEGGVVENPMVVRFYRAQLARYQTRQ